MSSIISSVLSLQLCLCSKCMYSWETNLVAVLVVNEVVEEVKRQGRGDKALFKTGILSGFEKVYR